MSELELHAARGIGDRQQRLVILEGWEIWLRWQAKYKNGEVALDTYPALPEDRPRYETLKRELEGPLVTDPACRIYLRGGFLRGKPADNWDGYSVERLSVDRRQI